MPAPQPDFGGPADIAIVGGGPVGLALACQLLRTTGWRMVLVDAATPARAARDPRAIALSHGSRQLLEQIGAWPVPGSPIEHIHVSQRGRFGHVRLHHDDYGVPALGYVVRYGELCNVLERALAQAAQAAGEGRLRRAFETRIERIEQDPLPRGADVADAGMVQLQGTGPDGQAARFAARLAVQAEGGLFHEQAAHQGRGARTRDYRQTAVIAHVTCSRPQPGWAWERFTEEGPLALLPHEEHGTPGYALVWCCPPEQAARRLALPEAQFAAELGRAFSDRMGQFALAGKRHAFPLGLNAAPVTVNGRVVAVGNAAQTLHPVAGQGLNLGLRDAFALADSLRGACTPQALQAFAGRHRLDRAVTIGVTDLLPRVFGIAYPLAAHARGASLAALACLPPLRHALARHMMFGMRR
ncbi:UbiH/UbiF/VisC/COQ6 family ubiquinone biosynthesis hydroxylase [Cupriavidus taiwanensis]|uniref:2-octaprenyl-6-methoxyphenol hydroxylase, FAD/NAD(P)-binding n=1 Tax=Cupriavidus taiwanensis TaxID=164546 RepID=A0A7Z7J5R5_9BURK|nr:UbiH/UbiF/VisC/COQ6 family ubiquinone biosynthesis hydroxylase [Cupriavidus taiwanensis]SOY87216.1 2-octaprenyl-6-methoxyphenol hydroxylase, FAD/NAD(P)-binding [Cupriavidus taiwanensis]SOZ01385.1 2-octaprenyl-6-methoxyphenol hydroxylase, FAD/NAD(P)-binding [Cupriavidus taiwanensis]SOZ04289.1 2-octaprenyl-6-methoxyphenol hydroxylase, FAD/NAD(P)-binding [Cupriavidus taiwanensis]SPC08931.1 2-octaprenyl-6-methoxyphenol hydroxylase, FAD/NAD(P)-binding [Cupriavidus taiwanensis]SPD38723.1 2-octapr